MVDDLLGALKKIKSTMEYRNLDFNADKVKQYEAVRQTMHSRCGSNFENNYLLSKAFAPNPARPGLAHPCNRWLNTSRQTEPARLTGLARLM